MRETKFGHLLMFMTSVALILSLSYETVQASRYLSVWVFSFEADESSNTPPIASDDTYVMEEDTILSISAPGVLGNDSDVDNDPISAFVVSSPEQGDLTLNNNGSFTFFPNLNFNGTDSFVYVANDGLADSNVAMVTITVTSVNDPPVANTQEVTLSEDSSVGIFLTASDVDGDSLTFSIVTQPAHGLISGTAPNLTYTPDRNYNGLDSFNFKVNDGQVDSNVATVSITVTVVNDAPVAVNDAYMVNEDTVLNIPAPGVLGNDYDIDGDTLSVQLVSNVSRGTLILNSNGSFTYIPTVNYYGMDSFTYRAYDGQLYSEVATVTITVNNLNDPPIALNDSYTVAEDTPLDISAPGVLSNDTDPEGGSLSASKVSDPMHGTLILNSNGGFTYLPAPNYYGTDSFTYVANDGQANSEVATVSIVITPVNDPPVANPQARTVTEDDSIIIVLTGTDVDGDTLTFNVVIQPAHGGLRGTPPSLTYIPNPDYNGSDSFTFKVNDGQVDSNVAVVSITVTPVNDPPVAIDDTYRANILGILEETPNVLGNDRDVEGDTLTVELVDGPDNGTLNMNNHGDFTYVPNSNYLGDDSFTYRIYDGEAYSDPAKVTIKVDSVRPLPPDWIQPVGNESIYILRENTVNLEVIAHDTDINYVRFLWWNPEGGENGQGGYEDLGLDTESPFLINLSFSRLPVNQLSQVFAEVWDDFGNVSLNTLNKETYLQTVRRIFIFPTTFRNQIYLPLISK